METCIHPPRKFPEMFGVSWIRGGKKIIFFFQEERNLGTFSTEVLYMTKCHSFLAYFA